MIGWHLLHDYEALSRRAADTLLDNLRENPRALICLAAGSTPTRTYQLLAEYGGRDPQLFARSRWIKLDEWGGLSMDDPATCEKQLRDLLITPLALSERYTAFNSNPENPEAECNRIASWLTDNGPIDVAVLGLGINGHLGFNEPAEFLQQHSHIARLSDSSLSHSMLDASGCQPTFGLTLGVADLLAARSILLLVSGRPKRAPLQRFVAGGITTVFPASLLHMHRGVTVLYDTDADPNLS